MTGAGLAGLYVHVPFCSAVCPYCDFAVRRDDPARHASYVEAIATEAARRDFDGPFDTIYLGGGTPSALGPAALSALVASLRTRPGGADAMLHMEANPEDVNEESLALWRDLGVRFLSLGVQSFRDDELRFLGRRHDGREAREAIGRARSAGIPVVSVDLIFGLPDQDEGRLRESLAVAADLDHVSAYQLTIEPRTPFGQRARRGALQPASDETQGRLFEVLHSGLAEVGLSAYELSNFARSEATRSRHNPKYWEHLPYLGLGPGAHSFDGRRRRWNLPSLTAWETDLETGGEGEEGSEVLTPLDLARERLLLGLRRPEGLDLAGMRDHYGWDLDERRGPALDRGIREGWWSRTDGRLRPTLAGMAIADALARDLAPDDGEPGAPRGEG
ncbi:MAG: radical SAM family heme chaperone HemW [Planctomycetota bacterium]